MFSRRFLPAIAVLAALFATPHVFAQQTPVQDSKPEPPVSNPEWTDIPLQSAENSASATPTNVRQTNFDNFASCPISVIQQTVRELAHLKSAQDQSPLASLLDNIGAKTVNIANKTPNLISREVVVTERNNSKEHDDFSFLVLQHSFGKGSRVFDEYRVDVATGEKIQTEFAAQAPTSSESMSLRDLPVAGPASQGFFSTWLYFYPSNRKQFDFRYLGEQKINEHHAQVVAFAQKPALVELPTTFSFENQLFPVFMQGVAWVDAADFAILRLRLDLLMVPSTVPLRQFTVDSQFAQVNIAELNSPLWLPTQIVITTNLAGSIERETHTYSSYRLFRTRSKLVLK